MKRYLWLIVPGMLLIVIFLLAQRFPHAVEEDFDLARLVYLSLLVMLLGMGMLPRGLSEWQNRLRDAGIWLFLILAASGLYAYKDVFLNSRLGVQLFPHLPGVQAGGDIVLGKADDGHFHLEAQVNGARVLFMIDTGASDVVLSPRDAARAGIKADELEFTRHFSTANGVVRGAPVRLKKVTIAGTVFRDLPASVNEAAMSRSLLGMRFLEQFQEVQFKGNTLTLKP